MIFSYLFAQHYKLLTYQGKTSKSCFCQPIALLRLCLVQSFLEAGIGLQLGSLVHCARPVGIYLYFGFACFRFGEVFSHLDTYKPPFLLLLGQRRPVFIQSLNRTPNGLLVSLIPFSSQPNTSDFEFEVDYRPLSRTML